MSVLFIAGLVIFIAAATATIIVDMRINANEMFPQPPKCPHGRTFRDCPWCKRKDRI